MSDGSVLTCGVVRKAVTTPVTLLSLWSIFSTFLMCSSRSAGKVSQLCIRSNKSFRNPSLYISMSGKSWLIPLWVDSFLNLIPYSAAVSPALWCILFNLFRASACLSAGVKAVINSARNVPKAGHASATGGVAVGFPIYRSVRTCAQSPAFPPSIMERTYDTFFLSLS